MTHLSLEYRADVFYCAPRETPERLAMREAALARRLVSDWRQEVREHVRALRMWRDGTDTRRRMVTSNAAFERQCVLEKRVALAFKRYRAAQRECEG